MLARVVVRFHFVSFPASHFGKTSIELADELLTLWSEPHESIPAHTDAQAESVPTSDHIKAPRPTQ